MTYVETHGHSDYSILDGVFVVEERVKRAKALGMPAVALTDHGNMHGAIQFYKAAKKHAAQFADQVVAGSHRTRSSELQQKFAQQEREKI